MPGTGRGAGSVAVNTVDSVPVLTAVAPMPSVASAAQQDLTMFVEYVMNHRVNQRMTEKACDTVFCRFRLRQLQAPFSDDYDPPPHMVLTISERCLGMIHCVIEHLLVKIQESKFSQISIQERALLSMQLAPSHFMCPLHLLTSQGPFFALAARNQLLFDPF